jgi:hypothetical protein
MPKNIAQPPTCVKGIIPNFCTRRNLFKDLGSFFRNRMNENNITKYYCFYLCPRGRVAFGSHRFGCLSAAHRTLIRSIGVFLARGRFAAKTPIMSVGFPWISLDSLVRVYTFQSVKRPKAGKSLSRAFPLR